MSKFDWTEYTFSPGERVIFIENRDYSGSKLVLNEEVLIKKVGKRVIFLEGKGDSGYNKYRFIPKSLADTTSLYRLDDYIMLNPEFGIVNINNIVANVMHLSDGRRVSIFNPNIIAYSPKFKVGDRVILRDLEEIRPFLRRGDEVTGDTMIGVEFRESILNQLEGKTLTKMNNDSPLRNSSYMSRYRVNGEVISLPNYLFKLVGCKKAPKPRKSIGKNSIVSVLKPVPNTSTTKEYEVRTLLNSNSTKIYAEIVGDNGKSQYIPTKQLKLKRNGKIAKKESKKEIQFKIFKGIL